MTMRRKMNRKRRGDHFLLSAYWLLSGYGLRAGRAFLAFVLLAVGAAATVVAVGGFDPVCNGAVCPNLGFHESVLYMARASVSFTYEPGNHLNEWQSWLQLAVRFVGPTLLALGLLALRARFKR